MKFIGSCLIFAGGIIFIFANLYGDMPDKKKRGKR